MGCKKSTLKPAPEPEIPKNTTEDSSKSRDPKGSDVRNSNRNKAGLRFQQRLTQKSTPSSTSVESKPSDKKIRTPTKLGPSPSVRTLRRNANGLASRTQFNPGGRPPTGTGTPNTATPATTASAKSDKSDKSDAASRVSPMSSGDSRNASKNTESKRSPARSKSPSKSPKSFMSRNTKQSPEIDSLNTSKNTGSKSIPESKASSKSPKSYKSRDIKQSSVGSDTVTSEHATQSLDRPPTSTKGSRESDYEDEPMRMKRNHRQHSDEEDDIRNPLPKECKICTIPQVCPPCEKHPCTPCVPKQKFCAFRPCLLSCPNVVRAKCKDPGRRFGCPTTVRNCCCKVAPTVCIPSCDCSSNWAPNCNCGSKPVQDCGIQACAPVCPAEVHVLEYFPIVRRTKYVAVEQGFEC